MIAINMLFFAGDPQLGEVESGFTAHLWGGSLSVAIGGIACTVMTGIVALITPELRQYTNGLSAKPEKQGRVE